ncbi:hypothetical protein J6590_093293 [Homalodisca vitripennis]|nr:hypothetical protein J6590_048868 [Homalodisca vitripennis]KAG8334317.1 hypothetical protein J6590_093293 [Homalodisca vitripennis]
MSSDNEDHLINPAGSVHRQQNPLSVNQPGEVEESLPNRSSFSQRPTLNEEDTHAEILQNAWGIIEITPSRAIEKVVSDSSCTFSGDLFPSIAHGQAIRDHKHVNFDEEPECEVMSEQTRSDTNVESVSEKSGQVANHNKPNLKTQNLAKGLTELLKSQKRNKLAKKVYLQQKRITLSSLQKSSLDRKSRILKQRASLQQAKTGGCSRKSRGSRKHDMFQKTILAALNSKLRTLVQQEIGIKRKRKTPRKVPPQEHNSVSIPATCSKDPGSLQGIETGMETDATDNGTATVCTYQETDQVSVSGDGECNMEMALEFPKSTPLLSATTSVTSENDDDHADVFSDLPGRETVMSSPRSITYSPQNNHLEPITAQTLANKASTTIHTPITTSIIHKNIENISSDTQENSKTNEHDNVMLQDEAFEIPHPEASQSCTNILPNSPEFHELTTTDKGLEHNQDNLTELDTYIRNFPDRDECFTEFLENFFTVFDGSVELLCKKMADLLYLVITESRNCSSRVTTAELLSEEFREAERSSALKNYDEKFNKCKLDFEDMFNEIFEKISCLIVHENCKIIFLLAWFNKVFLHLTSISPDFIDSLHEVKANVISLLAGISSDCEALTRVFKCDETFELNCWQVLDLMLDCISLHEKQGTD